MGLFWGGDWVAGGGQSGPFWCTHVCKMLCSHLKNFELLSKTFDIIQLFYTLLKSGGLTFYITLLNTFLYLNVLIINVLYYL